MNRNPNLTRDPVSGVPAYHADMRLSEKPTAEELADRIRATRARMTGTIDEIEERLAPSRIASEVKRNVRETIDDVRDQIHPRRMAKTAGNNMLDTIKENPIPALVAGVSFGYLVMKAASGEDERSSRRRFERRARYSGYESQSESGGRGDRPWEYDYRFEEGSPYTPPQQQAGMRGSGDYGMEEESGRERIQERASEIRHEISERGEHIQRRAGERAREARRQAREAGRSVQRRASRAETSIEDFVYENPLIAGLISAGIGAAVGAALPSTRREDELMGQTRDELVDTARSVVEEKSGKAREAARHVGEDARKHVEELAETAREEARSVTRSDGSTERQAQAERSQRTPGSTVDRPNE